MRRSLLAALVLGPAALLLMTDAGVSTGAPASASPGPAAAACDSKCSPEWLDANLRLNQVQLVGTNASTKQRPESGVLTIIRMGGRADAEALDFAQPALAAQLDGDVRALSFDIVHDPRGGAFRNPAIAGIAMSLLAADYVAAMKQPGFKVMHVPDVDYRSSCLALRDCLGAVAAWSHAHPRHMPILITLRPNGEKTPMPGAVTPPAFDKAAWTALEREVHGAFQDNEILTPAMVKGAHASLRAAVLAGDWPRLGAARGKVLFVLEGKAAAGYQGGLMFAVRGESRPDSAILVYSDPIKDRARIAAATSAGFLVITRADEETREARAGNTSRRDAAFASGAQVVLTDFAMADPAIGPYRVTLADQPAARCGAMLASEKCLRILDAPAMTMASLP